MSPRNVSARLYFLVPIIVLGLLMSAPGQIFFDELVKWKDVANRLSVSADGTTLTRTAATSSPAAWDADAISEKYIVGDGYVEFRFGAPGKRIRVGLAPTNPDNTWTTFDYGVAALPTAGGIAGSFTYQFIENGANVGTAGEFTANTVFRIERVGTEVRYYVYQLGSQVLPPPAYRSLVQSQGPLLIDTSFVDKSASIVDCRYFGPLGPEDIVWAEPVGTTPSYLSGGAGSTLTKAGTTSVYDADAISFKAIADDGYVRFRFGQTNKNVAVGLTSANSDRARASLEYAICAEGASVSIYEGNVLKAGPFTPYTINDVFRIQRDGGTIAYYKNDILLYTSATPSEVPLLVDTAFASPGAFVTNCQYEGSALAEPVVWTDDRLQLPFVNQWITANGSTLSLTNYAVSVKNINPGGMFTFAFGASTTAYADVGMTSDYLPFGTHTDGPSSKFVMFGFRTGWDELTGLICVYTHTGYEASKQLIGVLNPSDRLSLRRANGKVEYLRNDEIIRSEPDVPGAQGIAAKGGGPGEIHGCLYYGSAEELIWRAQGGATPSIPMAGVGTTLTRGTAAAGWTAGAISSRMITGDGYVEFKFSSPAVNSNKDQAVGLAVADPDKGIASLDYAIRVVASSTQPYIRIYEKGVGVYGSAANTPFISGDSYGIRRRGTTIEYLTRGQVFYTSTKPSTGALLVDASLNDPSCFVKECFYSYRDSDSDGLDDEWEAREFGDLARTAAEDSDFDGVDNLHEFYAGTPPFVYTDVDGDSMADQWEMLWFSTLTRDGSGDLDGDSINDLTEFAEGKDPTDFFNGDAPKVVIIGGDNQKGRAGRLVSDPLEVEVRNSANTPLSNAPVKFSVTHGNGRLLQAEGGTAVQEITLRSAQNGRSSIRFQLPFTNQPISKIRAGVWSRSGGYELVEFTAYAEGAEEPAPAGATVWLKAETLASGAVETWNDVSGNGNHATKFASAAAATRPTLSSIGSIPAVSFDGVDDRLTLPSEIGNNNFTVIAVVSSEAARAATTVGTSYGRRSDGATDQRYLFGGPRPSGASPWPTPPTRPPDRKFSRWTNLQYTETVWGRVYVPLQGNEAAFPVPTQYSPVHRRYDVTNNLYYNGVEYVENPRGGWSLDACYNHFLTVFPEYNGWAPSRSQIGSYTHNPSGLPQWSETYYEVVAAATWPGLTNATQPNASVLTQVSAGISVGTNGLSTFDLRTEYHPTTGLYSRTATTGLRVVTVKLAGRAPTIYDNGEVGYTGAASLASSVRGPQYIGSAGIAGNYFEGKVAEIIIYNRALSNDERRAMEDHLAQKYKISTFDRDNDGLPDWWERRWFDDLDETGTGNADGDGFTNAQEFTRNLNPTSPDTDQDGLRDDVEVNTTATNPLLADTDGDGFPDGYEVAKGLNALDPANGRADADGNKIQDGWDFIRNYNPATTDSDGDGLVDQFEFLIGANAYGAADSNGDGISDRYAWLSGANAFNMDHDGDGVLNSEELIRGTNPFLKDSDGDSHDDGVDAFPLDNSRNAFGSPNPSDTTPPEITVERPPDAQLLTP